jgi:hypothetical protein
VQVVVARYAEDLRWLDELPHRDIVVYDKNDAGDASHGNPPARAVVRRLRNEGREGHTYLHHILRHWDDLADVTIFLPGSAHAHFYKRRKLVRVVDAVCAGRPGAVPASRAPQPIHEHLAGLALDEWASTDADNARATRVVDLKPCDPRPFGRWYAARGLPPTRFVTYHGVFAASRDRIRSNPRALYRALLDDVRGHSNPEAGHYLERSWHALLGDHADEPDGPAPARSQ